MLDRLFFWLTPPTATATITRRSEPVATFRVEVARNIWRRARGLMGRQSLAENSGMLFVYPWPRVVRIWMTRVPMALDVLFIDQRGRVAQIVAGLTPSSVQWTSSGMAVSWVLELAAGVSEQIGIAVGDSVAVHMDGTAWQHPG